MKPPFSFLFLLAGAFPLAGLAADSLPPVPVDASAPKTHALFMGTDVSVEKEHKLYKIQRVAGTSFVISVDGKADLVPMRGGHHNLKLAQGLKLTAMRAELGGLSTERSYTAGNDPRMKRMVDSNRAQAAVGDNASLAEGQYTVAQNNGFLVLPAGNPQAPGFAQRQATQQQMEQDSAAASALAAQAQQMAADQMFSHTASGAGSRLDAESDLAKELYDAIEVNFTVTAPQPLNDPFLVIIVNYHNPLTKETRAGNMIHARALERIDTKPQKIHIVQGGLPPGYTLDSCQVHLYNYGEEVATNASPKHVSLTRDEAFGYLLAQYIGTHHGETMPAEPIIGRLSVQERAELSSAQLSDYYFVKVSRDGLPEAVFADEECTKPVDPKIEALAKNVRFYPALDKGQRVEGTARLVFTHLTL